MKICHSFCARIGMVLGTVFVLATFTACKQSVDLATIRTLAKSASDAQQSLDNVSQDFHDTCVRARRWKYLTSIAKGSQSAPTSTSVFSTPNDPYNPAHCDDPVTLAAVERMKLFNHLYIGYFIALGNIAGNKSEASAFGIQGFATSLTSNPDLKNVQGITESATFLAAAMNEYFDARKQKAISSFAGGKGQTFVNDTADKLIESSKNLNIGLGEEQDAVNDFYSEIFKHATAATDMLSALSFRKQWAADLADVQARRDALASYQKVVGDLQKSHASLVDSIRNNSPSELTSIAQLYISEFSPLVDKMNKAFK